MATNPAPAAKPVDPLEVRQREAIAAAQKLIATNALEKALQTVVDAEKLNGPLTPDLQKMQTQIEDSLKNAELRQLRLREAQLWNQATESIAAKRYAQAVAKLNQIRALPQGGVHREDAQQYLTEVIPKLQQQDKLSTQARESLRQGDFRSARQFAAQLSQTGGDARELTSEIDKSEGERLAQLEGQFNQLKQADDDAAVQQLKALQPKLQALAASGGPRSAEAQNYVNNLPSAVAEVQGRAQSKRLDQAYQSAVQKAQQALGSSDKNALQAARDSLQSFAQGGPHAGEAQRYLSDINTRLNALNQPAPLANPVPKPAAPAVSSGESDADVLAVIQKYRQAFEHRDADALRQIWPSMGNLYNRYRQSFGGAASIQMQVDIVEVKMGADGASATVKTVVRQEFTPKGGKSMSSKDETTFRLAKSNGTWVIVQVQ